MNQGLPTSTVVVIASVVFRLRPEPSSLTPPQATLVVGLAASGADEQLA